ncbi:hypothetical protein K438DRAFT_1940654 [Mycena galopus ATCC 62051]|nr:hypothetical protein K438DRAFT_1940654 [Mycena galopus ATCC 62051]
MFVGAPTIHLGSTCGGGPVIRRHSPTYMPHAYYLLIVFELAEQLGSTCGGFESGCLFGVCQARAHVANLSGTWMLSGNSADTPAPVTARPQITQTKNPLVRLGGRQFMRFRLRHSRRVNKRTEDCRRAARFIVDEDVGSGVQRHPGTEDDLRFCSANPEASNDRGRKQKQPRSAPRRSGDFASNTPFKRGSLGVARKYSSAKGLGNFFLFLAFNVLCCMYFISASAAPTEEFADRSNAASCSDKCIVAIGNARSLRRPEALGACMGKLFWEHRWECVRAIRRGVSNSSFRTTLESLYISESVTEAIISGKRRMQLEMSETVNVIPSNSEAEGERLGKILLVV